MLFAGWSHSNIAQGAFIQNYASSMQESQFSHLLLQHLEKIWFLIKAAKLRYK